MAGDAGVEPGKVAECRGKAFAVAEHNHRVGAVEGVIDEGDAALAWLELGWIEFALGDEVTGGCAAADQDRLLDALELVGARIDNGDGERHTRAFEAEAGGEVTDGGCAYPWSERDGCLDAVGDAVLHRVGEEALDRVEISEVVVVAFNLGGAAGRGRIGPAAQLAGGMAEAGDRDVGRLAVRDDGDDDFADAGVVEGEDVAAAAVL